MGLNTSYDNNSEVLSLLQKYKKKKWLHIMAIIIQINFTT